MLDKVRIQLGSLEQIIQEHGFIAATMNLTLAMGKATMADMIKIRNELDAFGEEVREFADAAHVSKKYLLTLISQVLDVAKQGLQCTIDCVTNIELLFGQGTNTPIEEDLPQPLSQVSREQVLPGLDGDTPLGTVQVGGSDTALSANLLFQMIRDLQAKVNILTKRSKNTGIIFNCQAFASEAEFPVWFTHSNPAGECLAGFVIIVSIWAFGTADYN